MTIDSNIVDNVPGGQAPLILVMDSASQANGVILLQGSNSYSGGTFVNGSRSSSTPRRAPGHLRHPPDINGGNNNARDSLPIANAVVTLLAGNQINPAANVTLNGIAELNLNSFSNTIANLTIYNDGGCNGENGPAVFTGTGALTLTGSLRRGHRHERRWNDHQRHHQLQRAHDQRFARLHPQRRRAGHRQRGARLHRRPARSAWRSTRPSASPAMRASNLSGGGVVSIGGQSANFGPVNVARHDPGLRRHRRRVPTAIIGGQVNPCPPAPHFDARGYTGTLGSLTGSGTLTNSPPPPGPSTPAWTTPIRPSPARSPIPSSRACLSLTKVGTGNMTLTATTVATGLVSPNLGTLTVNGGGVTLTAPGGTGLQHLLR